MRKLSRPDLDQAESAYLAELTGRVLAAQDAAAEAASLWKNKNRDRFAQIRRVMQSFAPGLERCMYCEDSQGTDIDHFDPKARNPAVAFQWDNYLLACSHCNSNEKRDEFPLTDDGSPELLDPTVDDPFDHLVLNPVTGEYASLTLRGLTSSRVFGLNRELLARGRYDAWIACEALLERLSNFQADGATAAATQVEETLLSRPFSEVLITMYLFATRGYQLLNQSTRGALLSSEAIASRCNKQQPSS